MSRTLYAVILAMFAYGCTTSISASERELSAREDARDAALWQAMVGNQR